MTSRPWPSDVPSPRAAPPLAPGETWRDRRRPATLVREPSRTDALRSLLRWAHVALLQRAALLRVLSGIVGLVSVLADRRWGAALASSDLARERAEASAAAWQAAASAATGALERCAEVAVEHEARLDAARAALAPLEALAARGSPAAREAVARMREALG